MVSLNFPTLSLKGRTRQNTRKWPFKSSQAKKNSWVLSTFAHVSRHPEGRKKQNNKWDHTVMRCAYGVYVYKLTIPYIIYMTEWRMRKAYMVYIYICMINNIREQRVCFVCVCVQTILCQYKTTFMVHLASLPRTCPFISAFMFLCSKTSSRSSTHPNWHTVTLHYLILGDKTKARPQSHCELYAASDPPQSLHWERHCNLGVNQSINVCEDIPSYPPQVALIFTTVKQKSWTKSQKAQQSWNVYVSKQIQLLIFLDSPLCLRSMTLQGYELLLVSWESRYETNAPKTINYFWWVNITNHAFLGGMPFWEKRISKQYWLKGGRPDQRAVVYEKICISAIGTGEIRSKSIKYIYVRIPVNISA